MRIVVSYLELFIVFVKFCSPHVNSASQYKSISVHLLQSFVFFFRTEFNIKPLQAKFILIFILKLCFLTKSILRNKLTWQHILLYFILTSHRFKALTFSQVR